MSATGPAPYVVPINRIDTSDPQPRVRRRSGVSKKFYRTIELWRKDDMSIRPKKMEKILEKLKSGELKILETKFTQDEQGRIRVTHTLAHAEPVNVISATLKFKFEVTT